MRFFLIPTILLLISGCSRFNCSPLKPLLGDDLDLVRLGYEIGDQLITRSRPPIMPGNPEQPVLIATFVSNDDLNKTSSFGRVLQDHVSSRFVRQGFAVREVKLRRDLFIRKRNGEFMLSRDLDLIDRRQKAQAVVVGTYSLANRLLYLSVRLVSPVDRTILAAVDKRVCLDEDSLRMLGLKAADDTRTDEIEPPSRSLLNKIFY